jgi:hypothetical protein
LRHHDSHLHIRRAQHGLLLHLASLLAGSWHLGMRESAQAQLELSLMAVLSGGMRRRGWGFCSVSLPSTCTYSGRTLLVVGPRN